MDRSLWN